MEEIGRLVKEVHKEDVGPSDDDNDWEAFRNAVDCHICEKPLDDDRVFDHDHLTGELALIHPNM